MAFGYLGGRESAKAKASECASANASASENASTAADPHLTGRPSYIRSSVARSACGARRVLVPELFTALCE